MEMGNKAMEVGLFVIVSVLLNVSFGQYLTNTCGDKIPGCYCTDTYIDCYRADIVDLGDIYPYITNKTNRINIANGNIRTIPDSAFINNELSGVLKEVKYLNISGNGLVEIHRAAFQLLPNLEILDLSNNNLPFDSQYGYMSKFDPLKILHKLRVLDLSYNNISYIGYMEIDVIEQDLVNLKSLKLGGNPFDCDCVLFDLVDWINRTKLQLDTDLMTCASSKNESNIGEPLLGLEYIHFCEQEIIICPFPGGPEFRITRTTLIAVILTVVMTVITVIVTVLLCHRRNRNNQRIQDKITLKADTESYITEDVKVSNSAPYKIIM